MIRNNKGRDFTRPFCFYIFMVIALNLFLIAALFVLFNLLYLVIYFEKFF